jgi:hypothetical protein
MRASAGQVIIPTSRFHRRRDKINLATFDFIIITIFLETVIDLTI